MGMKLDERAEVLRNEMIAPDVWQMKLSAPGIAAASAAGQFVHVRVAEAPRVQFLRMPFAVYERDVQAGTIDFVYHVVGEGTSQLATLKQYDMLDVIGPVGNGWTPPEGASRALLISGGVGAPALNLLAAGLAAAGTRVDAILGAQTSSGVVCRENYEAHTGANGGELFITTDDGSEGVHGFVTAVSDGLIAAGSYDYVAVCGPTPMMRNTVKPAIEHGVRCQVSMERLMACGVGACLSCVVDTHNGKKRCCVDGPVFEASEVLW